jgi:hypothetical protein
MALNILRFHGCGTGRRLDAEAGAIWLSFSQSNAPCAPGNNLMGVADNRDR